MSDRRRLEDELKSLIDEAVPCSLLNLENQLITGYGDAGFHTFQPWAPDMDFPPANLTFKTWDELGDAFHVNFFSHRKCQPAAEKESLVDSLEYAQREFINPTSITDEPYGAGPHAYEKWSAALEAGHADDHGNWWNATVWAECRSRAAEYYAEIACSQSLAEIVSMATNLSHKYEEVSEYLSMVGNKQASVSSKLENLRMAAESDAACARTAGELASLIQSD